MAANQANACCSAEKSRLVEQLRKCDMCTDNYEDFHQCYRDAARESGRRARACLMGA